MISGLFDQPNYVASKRMLDATVLRHEAIAANIANLETPNYKRVDLDPSFMAELKQAIASGGTKELSSIRPKLALDSSALAENRDGNTVQLENELTQLGQNYMAHSLETQMISGSLMRLRLAITGRA